MDNEKKIQKLTTEETEFKRDIGLFGGVSIIGGIMIGSGIFYLGSYVIERSGMSLGLSLLAWLLGGIVSLMGGLCFAEMGAAMPKSGGMTVYLNEAYHPIVGFLFGFSDWIIGGPGSLAAISIALSATLKTFFDISYIGVKIIAIALIVGLTIYNIFGVKRGSVLQNISMIAKLIPIGMIIIGALIVGRVSPDLSLTPPTGSVGFWKTVSMIAFAVVAALWAYEGWSNLNALAEEIKEPSKNLPRAILIGIGGVTLIYVLFNYSIYRVLPFETIKVMIENEDFYLGTEVAKRIFGNTGAVLVTVGMMISMFGSLNGLIIAMPRTYYSMAVEGHFFESFKKLHPKYKVPIIPLVVQCIFSVILVVFRSLDELTSLVVFTGMIYTFLAILGVIRLRKKYPDIERPYKIFWYPVSVIITALLFLGLVINTFFDDPTSAIIGISIPVIGIIVYYIFDRKLKTKERQEA